MLATVIVRTLGRPSLAASLASVVTQQRDDVGLVIVDALGSLAAPDAFGLPLRWVSRGVPLHRSVAAQAGLDAVTTRWALFLDDDDLLLPGHLSKLLAALEAAPQAVLAHADVELIGQGSFAERRGVFDKPFEPWELLLGNRMPIHAALFDAALAQREGLAFDATLDIYEDWDFWLQLRCHGEFVHAPGVSAQYVVGDQSSAAHRTRFGNEAYWRVWRKWWSRAPADWWSQALGAATQSADAVKQLQSARETLAQHSNVVSALHAELDARMQVVSELRDVLEHTQQQLRESQALAAGSAHQLAVAQGSLRWTQDVLESTRGELQSTHQQLAERSHQLGHMSQVLAATQIEQRRTADQVQALMQSSSWRLTQPLRNAVDLARRARQSAGRFRREVTSRQTLLRGEAFHSYQRWIRGPEAREHAQRREQLLGTGGASNTKLSLLMPVFNPEPAHLDAAIASVLAQSHADWELCIADDASTRPGLREQLARWGERDPRIRVLQRANNGRIAACTNSAATLAGGDWLLFMDQDDVLAPLALAEVAGAIAGHAAAGWVYSDEDKLDAGGRRVEPHFKPGFSIELLRGQNFLSHLSAIRRSLFAELGGLREGFDGAQDHDLALRAAERLRPEQVVHVPRVLYHWRAAAGSTAAAAGNKAYAVDASLRAVAEHLARSEPGAQPEALPGLPWLRVRHGVPPESASAAFAESPSDAAWAERLLAFTSGSTLQRQDDGRAPWLLRLAGGLWPSAPSWLDEMVAQIARPGVGLVAGAVYSAGRLVQGALVTVAGASAHTLCAGVRRGAPGPFGAALLARGADAVTPQAMLMRRELWPLWQQAAGVDPVASALAFAGAVRAAGWRVVWTPFASFDSSVER